MTDQPTPELNAALCKAQSEMGPARKGKVNPAFRSNYADLASVIEAVQPLHDNGLAYSQLVAVDGDIVGVRTVLRHVSGQTLDCGSMTARAKDASAQAIGSALTYLRRYSLMTACGIASADDDGQGAGKPNAPQSMPTPNSVTWLDNDAEAFAEVIGRLGLNMGQVEAVCAYKKRPHPRNMTLDQRLKLIAWLGTPDGDAAVSLATKGKE
jgi:hypothetical protein